MISRLVRTEAVVLRNVRYGETSRVATLFTRELGKIGGIAKGARDPKSPFGASLEILSHSEFVLYHRSGRDLQFLKEGETVREFTGILRSPRRFLTACAWTEMLDRVVLEEEPAEELFELCLRGLAAIESAPEALLPEYFRGLQLRAASHLGYAPQLSACGRCGLSVPESAGAEAGAAGIWSFSLSQGTVFCETCAEGEDGDLVRLSARGVRRLRNLALGGARWAAAGEASGGGGPAVALAREAPETYSAVPSPAWITALSGLAEGFLRYHLSAYRGLRSWELAAPFFESSASGAANSSLPPLAGEV